MEASFAIRGMDAAFAGSGLEGTCFLLWGDASARAAVRSVANHSSIIFFAFIEVAKVIILS